MPEDLNLVMTLSSPIAIVAIVNWLKALGVKGRWATLSAVVVALGIGTAEMYLDSEVYAQYGTFLLLGLAAAGFYDLTKNIGTSVNIPLITGDQFVGRLQVEQGGSLVMAPDSASPPAQWGEEKKPETPSGNATEAKEQAREDAVAEKYAERNPGHTDAFADTVQRIQGGATVRTTESKLRET